MIYKCFAIAGKYHQVPSLTSSNYRSRFIRHKVIIYIHINGFLIIPNQVLIFHPQQFTPIWCSCFLDLPSIAAHLKRLLSWASIKISSYSAYWLTNAFSPHLAVLGKKNIRVLIGKTSYSVRTSYKYLQTVTSDPGATSSTFDHQTKFTIVIEAWASLPDENNDIISSKTLLNSTWSRTV